MQHKASRSLVDLWRRMPPTTARLLDEATKQGRPVRALIALLAVTILGTGGYAAGRAMIDRPSDRHAESADTTASSDGGLPVPTSDDPTPGGGNAEPSASATGPSEAPSPTTTATQAPPPRLTSATGSPSTAPATPSTSPSETGTVAPATPEDTRPPQTSVSEDFPAGDAALFTFSANEPATFTCSIDEAAYTSCGSPLRYLDLPAGWHTLAVRATDAAGNTDPTPVESRWHSDKGDS
jgi:hypothetical protein